MRLLLLTGARLREVMCAEWSEIDWARGVLLVPAERASELLEGRGESA